jgi:hypothetical protein
MSKNELVETIYRNKLTKTHKPTKVKKGVLVACSTETKEYGPTVGIGFSLCHRRDRFDYHPGTGQRVPGWGRKVAKERAKKWVGNFVIEIPPSIEPELYEFISRCQRYFKDKALPPWAEIVLHNKVSLAEEVKQEEQ